jgi:branched-chain amino acid transport system permease protein
MLSVLTGVVMSFITYLLNGISLGSVYSIIALGYTMVYGIAKMLNFAHGDVIMIGGYIIFTIMSTLGLNPILAVLISIILCTLLGITIERIAYKPLRRAPSLAVLITAIGVSYLLQNVALIIFGAEAKSFSSVIPVKAMSLAGGKLTISGETLVTIPLCILIMTVLTIFIKKSKTGRGMIAVSEDKDAAVLMGVNVNKTIAVTFAIGSALAAVASSLMFSTYTNLSTTSGAMPGIKAFVAAVFGGIGSIPGAMIGGILLGVIEILSRAYISTQLGDAIVFLILIIVLLVKPTGILGKKIQEKV